jgi:hypothetical protein
VENNLKFKAGGLLNTFTSYSKQRSKSQYLRQFCASLSTDTNNLWTSFFTDGVEQIIATKPAYKWKPRLSHLTHYNKHDTLFNLLIYSHSFHIFMYRISRPIRRTFFPKKCDLNLTCVLCAEVKYYLQTYKYPYSYYTTSLSWDSEICFQIMRYGITACEWLTFL